VQYPNLTGQRPIVGDFDVGYRSGMHSGAHRFANLQSRLGSLTLLQRFALTGGVIMIISMLLVGQWVTSAISGRVVENTAAATALFMDSFIAPLAQELDTSDALSIGPIRAIEELLEGSALGQRVVSIKIWKPGGLVAFANDSSLIGQRFHPSASLIAAFEGRLGAELNQLDDPESAAMKDIGEPLLEIYSPIRLAWSGRVIAVAEFYETATQLSETLAVARRQSWAIVAGVTGLIGIALFGIVHRASTVIEEQRRALQARINEVQRMSEQSRQLRIRAERASSRLTELNETFLRRISSELHDGPAQLVGLAALRLNSIGKARREVDRLHEIEIMDDALGEALRDIRNICNGLILPDIEGDPIGRTIERVIKAHEMRTGTVVERRFDLNQQVPHPVEICVFRFVQEGLNNAYRHAGGAGQVVEASIESAILTIGVSNQVGTIPGSPKPGSVRGLGLAGLRERIESLGGQFQFTLTKEQGAEMTMVIRVDAEAFHE
jgi:signal transduction histidine kinase